MAEHSERSRVAEGRALLQNLASVGQHLHDTLCVALKGLDAAPVERGPALQKRGRPSSFSHDDMVAELRSRLPGHEDDSESAASDDEDMLATVLCDGEGEAEP